MSTGWSAWFSERIGRYVVDSVAGRQWWFSTRAACAQWIKRKGIPVVVPR